MFLSFIAPTYNVDKYLDDFFMSFIGLEKHAKFEIIIVNDEPKKDLTIWKNKYSNINIKIINNKINVGQGPSRAKGIKYVDDNSTHVIFIDPDDKLNSFDFVSVISNDHLVNFSLNRWYRNKKIFDSANGSVSQYKLNNVIHGISLPIKIAKQFSKYTKEGESNDMPIKVRLAKEYVFDKTNVVMVDYRIRKSSTINTTRSERRAKEEIQTWLNLKDEKLMDINLAIQNAYFELIINKKSFSKTWYKEEKQNLKSGVKLSTKINAWFYRVTNFWWLKNKLTNILTIRKSFK